MRSISGMGQRDMDDTIARQRCAVDPVLMTAPDTNHLQRRRVQDACFVRQASTEYEFRSRNGLH